jgi:hypothetical protein
MIYLAIEPYANLSDDDAKGQGAPAVGDGSSTSKLVFVGGNTGRNNGFYALGAAVAPAKLGPSTPRPPDFDAF